MITEFITTDKAIRTIDGADFVAPSGHSIRLDESTYLSAHPLGLHIKVYGRLLRKPVWLAESTAVLEVTLKERLEGDIPALQGHVNKVVRSKRATAILTSEHDKEGRVMLTVKGETLAAANRLLSDILAGKAAWVY